MCTYHLNIGRVSRGKNLDISREPTYDTETFSYRNLYSRHNKFYMRTVGHLCLSIGSLSHLDRPDP